MRYSAVLAGLVALAAAAPINVPVVGDVDLVEVPEVPKLPQVPKLPVELPEVSEGPELPVKRGLNVPVVGDLDLPVDVPKVPEVPKLLELPVELPIRRRLSVPVGDVDIVETVDDLLPEEVEDFMPATDGLLKRVAVTVDEQKVVSVVTTAVASLSKLIHVDAPLPAVDGTMNALPVKRATITVNEDKIVATVEGVIVLLEELIDVDVAGVTKRATVTVDEQKIVSVVEEVIAELSTLINVDASSVTSKRDLPAVGNVLDNTDVITTITGVITQLSTLLL